MTGQGERLTEFRVRDDGTMSRGFKPGATFGAMKVGDAASDWPAFEIVRTRKRDDGTLSIWARPVAAPSVSGEGHT